MHHYHYHYQTQTPKCMVVPEQKVKRAMSRQRADINCPRCGLICPPSERRAGHHVCARRADPDHARAMRDHAKAAAKAAPRPTAKETT